MPSFIIFLFWCFATLVAANLSSSDFVGFNKDDGEQHMYLIKYKFSKFVPGSQFAVHCTSPGCDDVYEDAVGHHFFESVDAALRWMTAEKRTEKNIIGLFKLTPLNITRKVAGTQKVVRNVPTEVDENMYEWIEE